MKYYTHFGSFHNSHPQDPLRKKGFQGEERALSGALISLLYSNANIKFTLAKCTRRATFRRKATSLSSSYKE